MKASEAMLLGSTMGEQLFCKLNDTVGGSCAIGAISLALDISVDEIGRRFPWLRNEVSFPCGCYLENEIASVIVHLNDMHHWTRERIAEWLAPIENKYLEERSNGQLDKGCCEGLDRAEDQHREGETEEVEATLNA